MFSLGDHAYSDRCCEAILMFVQSSMFFPQCEDQAPERTLCSTGKNIINHAATKVAAEGARDGAARVYFRTLITKFR